MVSFVFQYVSLLQQDGLPSFYADEQSRMRQLAFQFQEPPEPKATVRSVAENLLHYPAAHTLDQHAQSAPLEPGVLKSYLDELSPSNLRLFVLGPNLETDRVDPYYDTKYRVTPLDEAQLSRWGQEPISSSLALPTPNAFLPDDTSLVSDDGSTAPQTRPETA